MSEMEGQWFLAVQSQKTCYNMVVMRELRREVKWLHSEVRLQI